LARSPHFFYEYYLEMIDEINQQEQAPKILSLQQNYFELKIL